MNTAVIGPVDYQNGKATFHMLNTINEMVKSDTFRSIGYEAVKLIDPEVLEPQNQAFYYYIKSRYYYFLYTTHVCFSDLEKANTYIDLMIRSARAGKVRLKSNRFFVRAHLKFLMAKSSTRTESKEYFLQKADHLVESGLRYDPNSESFLWLRQQIDTYLQR